jgi:outer membrane immunogenic protein
VYASREFIEFNNKDAVHQTIFNQLLGDSAMLRALTICCLGSAGLAALSNVQAAENLAPYVGLTISASRQSIGDDERVSPRQSSLLSGSSAEKYIGGSISVGQAYAGGFRGELEYVFPKSTEYTSFWRPFNANANVFQIRSQRLMLNAYKNFPLSDQWSANAMVGLGAAYVKAKGWQGNPGRFLEENSQTRLAASVGAGLEYAVAPDWKLGLGYRYTYIGRIESGVNNYSTAAYNNVTRVGVQDETMRGKLREHNGFVALRKEF